VDIPPDSRRAALRIIRELLGLEGPDVFALLTAAESALGAARTKRCWELAGESPRKDYALASLAALVVGTRRLGEAWWPKPRRSSVEIIPLGEGSPPDEALAWTCKEWPTPLEVLSMWIASDVADDLWGPAVAYVDLNSIATSDRFPLPPQAKVGDRVVAAFDPGSRADARVVERPGGRLGSELDLDSLRHSPPVELEWAWGIASEPQS